MIDKTIQEQINYYKARASEYDEWFYRIGRYDRGAEINQRWSTEAKIIQNTLQELGKCQSVLELACGTGIWTQELIKIGEKITAVDASEEMIQINRHKLSAIDNVANVDYQQLNLFSWEPQAQYDLVFFAFWLSHVPPRMLDEFLHKVYQSVKPQGKVFIIDSRFSETSSAKNHPSRNEQDINQQRKLNNGQTFEIFKVYYQPDLLEDKLIQTGFQNVEVKTTDNYFIYSSAEAGK